MPALGATVRLREPLEPESHDRSRWSGFGRWHIRLSTFAVVAGITLVTVAIDAWWLWHFRRGYPLMIDESGYMGVAFHYASALKTSGVGGFWSAFTQQDLQAPLVPLTAVPLALIHQSVIANLWLELAFFSLLVILTYQVAVQFLDPWYGVLAAAVVATAPGVTDYSRVFLFAVPAAAVLAAAIYALLRSRSLEHRGWAIAFGVFLGLCPLTRTVMIALTPALIIAAALQVAVRTDRRRQASLNLALALTTGAAVAAVWFRYSLGTVVRYLTTSGYGAQSGAFQIGPGSQLTRIINQLVNAPLLILLTLTLVAGAIAAGRRVYRQRSQGTDYLRRFAASPVSVLLIVVLEGCASFASTRNTGTGFEIPLVAPIVLLSVWAMTRIHISWVRRSLCGALVLTSIFNVIAKSGVVGAVSSSRTVNLPVVGQVPLVNTVNPAVSYMEAAGYRFGPSTARWPASLQGWNSLNRTMAALLEAIAASRHRVPSVALGATHLLWNPNSVGLASDLHLGTTLDVGVLDPTQARRPQAAYRAQLSDPADPRNLLVVSDASQPFPPLISQAEVRSVARRLGFRPVGIIRLPDGQTAEILWRNVGAFQRR